jgi:hypothetical protein
MAKCWAFAFVALTMLGIAAQGMAEGAPVDDAARVDEVPSLGRVSHLDEYTRAAIVHYPG